MLMSVFSNHEQHFFVKRFIRHFLRFIFLTPFFRSLFFYCQLNLFLFFYWHVFICAYIYICMYLYIFISLTLSMIFQNNKIKCKSLCTFCFQIVIKQHIKRFVIINIYLMNLCSFFKILIVKNMRKKYIIILIQKNKKISCSKMLN